MSDASTATFAPPDCGICGRTMLVGELVRSFRDASGAPMSVCTLCGDHAARSGMEAVAGPRTLRVRAAGSVRKALIMPTVEDEAVDANDPDHGDDTDDANADGSVESSPGLAPPPASAASRGRELLETIQRQERELQQLRRESAGNQRLEDTQSMERMRAQIAELRNRLETQDRTIARLEAARIAETRPREIKRAALDAFNIAPDFERMVRISRTLGEPVIRVRDEGPAIPRRVELVLAWDIAWYRFLVKLDLGKGQASVHETGQGGDPAEHDYHHMRANAQWRDSGLVLL